LPRRNNIAAAELDRCEICRELEELFLRASQSSNVHRFAGKSGSPIKVTGLDSSRFAGHSLRAGFATSAALTGVDALEIARQTGHKSLSMVQRYTRPATIWQMNAAQRVGL
jgi:integrase